MKNTQRNVTKVVGGGRPYPTSQTMSDAKNPRRKPKKQQSPKAYSPRKMRDNNGPVQTMAPKWLADMDVKAKEIMAADMDENGVTRVQISELLAQLTFTDDRHEPIARERYSVFAAPDTRSV